MSTTITLEDGRVLLVGNGTFDVILEHAARHLDQRSDTLPGLSEWLLAQTCEEKGPGAGYLDVRELSSSAASQFRSACAAVHAAIIHDRDRMPWANQRRLKL